MSGQQSGHVGLRGTSQSVCSWWWRLSDGSGPSDPPTSATPHTQTGWPQSGPGSCWSQTLQRDRRCVENCLEKNCIDSKWSVVQTQTNIALFSCLQCEIYFAPFNKKQHFSHTCCFCWSVCVLTEVSVGDNVPVVLTAVTLNLHPVTIISRCLTELHCVSGVTSLVDYLLSLLICEIKAQEMAPHTHLKGFLLVLKKSKIQSFEF